MIQSRLTWFLALFFAVISFPGAVTAARAETIGFSLQGAAATQSPSDLLVTVLDDESQAPLGDAAITVSQSVATIDSADSLTAKTDASGTTVFKDAARSPKTLTVSMPGYARITIAGVSAPSVRIFLKPLPPDAPEVIASGTMPTWNALDDGIVRAGFVMKSLSALDLLDLQIESFVSPLKDEIDVLGPRQVPSNLILPPQDIFVMIGSISLNKPTYRLPLLPNRTVRLAGIQGEASVDDLLPAFQGGGGITMDILNKLHFTRVGLTSELTPTSDFQQDVDPVVTLSNKHQVLASQPPFAADVLVAAVTDLSGDRQTLLPTDIKLAASASDSSQVNTVSLTAPAQPLGSARDVVTVALANKGRKVSGIVTDMAGKVVRPGQYLPADDLADAQQLPDSVAVQAPPQGIGAAVFEAPKASSANGKAASYATWMVYTLPSAGSVTIPAQTLLTGTTVSKYSVLQFEFDKSFSETALDGRTIMRKLQRFTRSSAMIQ